MAIRSFWDIIACRKGHELAIAVYEITKKFPKEETFGLTSQMRRCAVSVPSNLAEGFKRHSKDDSIHFYKIAEGSLEELEYHLLLSKDLGYMSDIVFQRIEILAEETGRLIYAWKKAQK